MITTFTTRIYFIYYTESTGSIGKSSSFWGPPKNLWLKRNGTPTGATQRKQETVSFEVENR